MKQTESSDRPNEQGSPLGDLLRCKREAAGLSRAQLAERVGVSRPYISRLERGEYTNPSLMFAARVAKELGIGSEDLLAATGCDLAADPLSFGLYLRVCHPHWPDSAIQHLETCYSLVKHKYPSDDKK